MHPNQANASPLPNVVIVGGGFGGLTAAKALANQPVAVTLIDRTNHYLFQPLLYQVATAGLSPGDIAQPIRHILRHAENIRVIMATVERIEPKSVLTSVGQFAFDYLILAAGARHSYFGHDQWEAYAPGLKNLEDALELRRRILSAFERAEATSDPELQRTELTFVVIGAGPTGVEMAGAISELAKRTLVSDFRVIKASAAHVILLDAAPRVLPTFPKDLSRSAERQLKQMEVDVRVGAKVLDVTPEGVQLEGEFIRTRTIVWAAGNAANPLGRDLDAPTDQQGRIIANPDLTVNGYSNIFAVGDVANFSHQQGRTLAGIAPVAMQMGTCAARNILLNVESKPSSNFHYSDKGYMATIGRNRAVADLKIIRFGGFLAWLSWLFIHLLFLVGLRNQLQVFFQWVWAYFTFSRGARLVYGQFRPAKPPQTDSV